MSVLTIHAVDINYRFAIYIKIQSSHTFFLCLDTLRASHDAQINILYPRDLCFDSFIFSARLKVFPADKESFLLLPPLSCECWSVVGPQISAA